MLETSELARLVLAVVILPFVLAVGRRLRPSGGAVYYVYCILAVFVSYMVSVVEEYWLDNVMNLVQHTAIAAAGVFALLAALHVRRERAAERDDL